MMSARVALIARLRPRLAKVEEVRAIVSAFVAPTREEGGCMAYHLHETSNDAFEFVFYEIWRSEADYQAHLKTPYIRAFLVREGDLLEKPVVVERLRITSPE
jgi:quinol monooxygenase YgiN